MSDVELVIKINEEDYKKVLEINNRECEWNNMHDCYEAILNGTPLPKGHGRLIDADELLTSERPKGIADDVWKESHIYKLLSNAPTIIEADKTGSED